MSSMTICAPLILNPACRPRAEKAISKSELSILHISFSSRELTAASTNRKAKEARDVDPLGEPVQLSDIEKGGDGGAGDEVVKKGGEVAEAVDDAGMEIDGEATKEMP